MWSEIYIVKDRFTVTVFDYRMLVVQQWAPVKHGGVANNKYLGNGGRQSGVELHLLDV